LQRKGEGQMAFTQLHELMQQAEQKQMTISQLMLEIEQENTSHSKKEILRRMAQQFDVMEAAVRKGTEEPILSRSGITGGDGHRVFSYVQQGESFIHPQTLQTMAFALAVSEVNAGMGKIVATPTAGSAGILPAVLVYALDTGRFSREQIVESMLTAAALGLVIANSASISGAAGGCQAEIGSATAMAAGTLVELAGGTPEQVGHAVGLALKNSLGLVCDPIGGLVEVPCIIRNGLHAITALAAADMALAGVKSIVPPDEVVQVMYQIGNEMPVSLRETGIGGLAGTPTGKRLRQQIFGSKRKKDEA
jgi:L-serine dehydratase